MRRFFFTILFAALALAADAADKRIDFGTPIRNLDGSIVPQSTTDPSPVTLGTVIEQALIANNLPGDAPDGPEKARRYEIAKKVHAKNDALAAEEIALIKKVVGLAYGPLVIGRVTEVIDPAAIK